jgi:hypothetical protein
MRTFLRIIAAGITLIVVILLPFTLFGYQIGQILYSPKSMLNLVAIHIIGPSQSNLLTETLLRSLPSQLGIADDSVVGGALARAAEQPELQGSILPADLQLTYSAQGINAFYGWLDGPDAMPILELDMGPMKDHIGRNTVGLVETVLKQVPTCSAEESIAFASDLLGALLSGEVILESIPACLPEIVPLDMVAPAVGALLQQQLTFIPETIVLDNLVRAAPESMIELKEQLQLVKGILQWSWLPFVFLLLIAALVGGQSSDGIPRWLGWSLLLTALSTFLLSLVPASWWLAATAPQLADWPLLFSVPALAILGTVYEQAQQPLLWFVIGMAILGVALLMLAALLKRRQMKML